MKIYKILLGLFYLTPLFVNANDTGGVSLAPTRVILNEGKTSSIQFNNKTNEDLLLRAWISGYNKSDKSKDFVISPPLYRIKSNENIQFRINLLNGELPRDRESVFHINVLSIPPMVNDSQLQFAINSRVKLFYRPHKIAEKYNDEQIISGLSVVGSNSKVIIKNPSDFHITLDSVMVNNQRITSTIDFMIAPHSDIHIPFKNPKVISYRVIKDNGSKTKEIIKNI
ncbi:molecular chaperone [Escherichia coli]|nr:molecular chaperone [Escherichia coli]EFF0591181.1 molecular chaperone [Escherichia coli]EFF0756759.1 molecular chaperone [Escherichia coli]EFG6313528.1 molecular chaperone [Escherichia coli]EFG7687650.1 molecular chaperone [Escherichia coli]EFH0980343.1 molecular chaperone [Escherichia coli]